MVNENSTHPVQTVSYGTVLGIILFIIFIIILLLILYFLFGDCILDSYCYIIGNTSCYCPNPPACCEFIPGTAESCTFIQNQEEALRAYCANTPCYEGCIKNFELPVQNILNQTGKVQNCPAPDPIELEVGNKSLAHLCQFKDICNFDPIVTVCGISGLNACDPGPKIKLQQCMLPQCGVSNKNVTCNTEFCDEPQLSNTYNLNRFNSKNNIDKPENIVDIANMVDKPENMADIDQPAKLELPSTQPAKLESPPTPGPNEIDVDNDASSYNSDYSPYNEEYSPYPE